MSVIYVVNYCRIINKTADLMPCNLLTVKIHTHTSMTTTMLSQGDHKWKFS